MSSHDNDIICSGGDDMSFKLWDLRCFESPTSIVSKSYMAGVTCVKFPPSNEHSLMVGSYDEHLKLWDLRYLKKPTLDINAGMRTSFLRVSHSAPTALCVGNRWRRLAHKNTSH